MVQKFQIQINKTIIKDVPRIGKKNFRYFVCRKLEFMHYGSVHSPK